MTHPWFLGEATPRILAHRGFVPPDSENVAENSVAALAAGRATGTLYLESDCHLTADGDVVLFHDDDLRRVTGDPRRVADVRTRELTDIMSTRGGLAMLPDVFQAFPDARFNLDVKADAAAHQVGTLVAREAHRVLLTSFSDRRREVALAAARSQGGEPATSAGSRTLVGVLAALAARLPRLAARRLDGVDALQIPERHRGIPILSRRLLDLAHARGIEVHVWTVNDPDAMTRLIGVGVDGIVTDRADLGAAARAKSL
ncbi:glycerophosphodiester phosphodiesterase family protein [Microbacterium aquilitoris]|uniref:glycerophosphodiester phosphodiesterase family protein n=1 Tax=Microbacterium aquilitoris TaxID=3067307 RepID=UPI00288D32F0|nr:glycerophosphodiester phosphodiesterase family protein [Microbacterium sp. KSW2-22]MDT3343990.1 glycerophosphodiester phosphodiesterase family protein [Microbacterium sp. KSW2-22]